MTGDRHIRMMEQLGRDIRNGMPRQEAERRAREFGESVGLPLAQIESNIRTSRKWPPPPPQSSRAEASALPPIDSFCLRRNFTREALRSFSVVEDAEQGEILTPMRNSRGNITGWRRRRADGSPFSNGAKALSRRGDKNGMMVAPWPLPESGIVLVVEGETDGFAARSAGDHSVVATPGARPGRKVLEHLQCLLAGRESVLFPDPDQAGQKWLREVGRALHAAGAVVRYVPALDDDLDRRLARG